MDKLGFETFWVQELLNSYSKFIQDPSARHLLSEDRLAQMPLFGLQCHGPQITRILFNLKVIIIIDLSMGK